MKSNKYILILSLIIVTALSNILLTNIPNFSPIASVALFSGFYLSNKKLALLIPIACILVSDYFIGFHSLMWAVYISFALTVIMGIKMKTSSGKNVIINSVLSSLVFFLITNSAVWMMGGFYTSDLSGLALCLSMGIPFYKYTLLSSLIFSTALFGGFQILNQLINKYLIFSKKS